MFYIYLYKFKNFGLLLTYSFNKKGFRAKKEIILNEDGIKVLEKNELEKYSTFYKKIQDSFGNLKENIKIYNSNFYFPIHIQIELTNYCNLTCQYCYRCSITNKKYANYIDFRKLIIKLQLLKHLGLQEITITGGEATFHPNLKEILRYSVKNFESVELLTNGTNVRVLKDAFSEINPKLLEKLNISLGLNSWMKNYKILLNEKHFIYQAIELCHTYRPIRINAVDFKFNKNKAKKIENLLKNRNVEEISFDIAYPIGRAANYINIDHFIRYKIDLNAYYFTKNGKMDKNSNESLLYPCNLILRHSTIDPLGNIRPCALFPSSKAFGNLFNEGIQLFKNSKLNNLTTFPSPCSSLCGNCSYLTYCQGCASKGLFNKISNKKCSYKEIIYDSYKYNYQECDSS